MTVPKPFRFKLWSLVWKKSLQTVSQNEWKLCWIKDVLCVCVWHGMYFIFKLFLCTLTERSSQPVKAASIPSDVSVLLNLSLHQAGTGLTSRNDTETPVPFCIKCCATSSVYNILQTISLKQFSTFYMILIDFFPSDKCWTWATSLNASDTWMSLTTNLTHGLVGFKGPFARFVYDQAQS